MEGWTYGEKENDPSVSGDLGGDAVTYQYKESGEDDIFYTTVKPGLVGDYTVRATIAETDDYYGGTATAEFTIAEREAEAAPTFTAHRMVLASKIGLQFRAAFPENFDATGCYVNFALSDGRNFNVSYKAAQSYYNDKYFTCPLNPLELADTITAALHYGGGQTKVNTYSAMSYVKKGLSAESTMTDAEKTALAAYYNYYLAAFAYPVDE